MDKDLAVGITDVGVAAVEHPTQRESPLRSGHADVWEGGLLTFAGQRTLLYFSSPLSLLHALAIGRSFADD